MYKIGTGENGTVAGKIYLFAHCERDVAGYWVYCRKRLYLRCNGDEAGLISAVCPETFKKVGTLKLSCGNAYKDSKTANFNRNSPLLSDGESLFTIVVNFKKVKRSVRADMKEQYEKLMENKKGEVKKTQDRKGKEITKICEFYLVEFDISKHQKDIEKPVESSEKNLVEELFEGFSGYFNCNECLKALRLNSNNIEKASKWLLDEGESERIKTVVKTKRWTLLAQSLIQEGKETDVVENSVLSPNRLPNSQWTITKSQVTLYLNSATAKVFSTKEEDVKNLKDKEPSLFNTKEKVISTKNPITPKDCLEPLELKGTYIDTATTEQLDYNWYAITYSPLSHKFYALSFESSAILCLVEYNGFLTYNDSTISEQLKPALKEPCDAHIELAQKLCMLLKKAEGYRFFLPWKWNSWATIYKKMYDRIREQLSGYESAELAEKKQSSKLAKIKKRANHFMKLQNNEFLHLLSRNHTYESSQEEANSKKIDSNLSANVSERIYYTKDRISKEARSRKAQVGASSLRKDTHIIKENIKEFAFCTTGSWNSLEMLLKLIEDLNQPSTLLIYLYDQLFTWINHCQIFCNSSTVGCPKLIKGLRNHLLRVIKEELKYPFYNNYIKSYAWRILVANWSAFVTNTELQIFLFQEAVKSPLEGIKGCFYEILASPDSTPFELLYCRHCLYPPHFYPECPLRQSSIQIYQLVNKSVEQGKKGKANQEPEFIEVSDESYCEAIEKCRIEYWIPKIGILLLPACKEIEEYSLFGSNITIEARIRYYSEEVLITDNKEEILNRLRKEHNERTEQNWMIMKKLLLSEMEKEIPLCWNFYNNLIFNGMAILFSNLEATRSFASKLISFATTLLSKLNEITDNYLTIKKEQIPWISKLIEHLFSIGNYVYSLEDTKTMAIEMTPILLKFIDEIAKLVHTADCSAFNKCKEREQTERRSFVRRKVFETVHPYGRRESNKKKTFYFDGAIAVWCELDNRSQSENSKDTLSIYTNNNECNDFSNLSKSHKFSGKCSNMDPIVIIGDKINIDFRVHSQPQKLDPTMRWGFKVTLHPIYGQSAIKEAVISAIEDWDGKIPYEATYILHSAIKFLILYATKLSRKLIKGDKLALQEIRCNEFFKLPLIKAGLKFTKKPTLLSNSTNKTNNVENNGSHNNKKKYKLHKTIVDPIILKILDSPEKEEGCLIDLILRVRKIVKSPEAYEIEKKRESFKKEYIDQWIHAERLCGLALAYHMGYTITEKEVKIDKDGLQVIGNSLNEIIVWMLKRLSGVKEYYQLKLAFLEECSNCYEKYKEKAAEEDKQKVEKDNNQKPKITKPKKISVAKSRFKRKKIINVPQKQVKVQINQEDKQEKAFKISQLPSDKKAELKKEIKDKVHEMFSQRCQGNTDLLKSLAEILKIPYNSKDQSEVLRKIFNKLQDSLKSMIEFESPDVLPDEIPSIPPNTRNSYETIAQQTCSRATFLFELHNTERKEKVLEKIKSIKLTAVKPLAEEADPFAELLLVKTPSMQPFLQAGQTPVQAKKAVDDYLKWKHSKTPGEQSFPTTMDRAVVAVITGNYSAAKLRKALKLKERRGLFRKVGLEYLIKLMKYSKLNEAFVGTVARSLFDGPFNNIVGCSMEVMRTIIELCMKLCIKIIDLVNLKLNDFEKLCTKDVVDNSKCITMICNQTKGILDLLVNFIVITQEQNKSNIIASLCEASQKINLTEFLSRLLTTILISNKHLAELKYPANLCKLNKHLRECILAILTKFIMFISKHPNLGIQHEILLAIIQLLEKPNDSNEMLLNILYEVLVSFDIAKISPEVLENSANTLSIILTTSSVPCILRSVSRCSQLIIEHFTVKNLIASTIERIGSMTMLHNSPPPNVPIPEERKYYLILHLNSREDSSIFLLKALYNLENIHPTFTNKYQKDLTKDNKKKYDYRGPFENTPLFNKGLENYPNSSNIQKFSVLNNMNQQFDEIVKLTYVSEKAEDSDMEKLRKLNEKNFNRRISQHFSDAKYLQRILSAQSFVQYPIAVSHKEAHELASIFEKVYNGELETIPINPYMTEEAKAKKLKSGLTVAESYPLIPRQPKNSSEQNPSSPIVIAKGKLVMSLCETNLFKSYFNFKPYSRKYIKRMQYIPIDVDAPVIGSSYSLCIEEYVNLLRKAADCGKFKSAIKSYISQAFYLLEGKNWNDLAAGLKETIMGSLLLVSGWFKCVRIGTSVEAVVNNVTKECTVVSGGFGSGSQTVGVVVKGDESLVVHKIPLDCVKPKHDLSIHNLVSEESLIKGLLSVNEAINKKTSDRIESMILILLLKIAVEFKWKENTLNQKKFMEVLLELSKNNSSEIIKRSGEDNVAELWEKLVEKSHQSDTLFYILYPQQVSQDLKKKPTEAMKGKLKSVFEYVQPVSSYLRSLPNNLTSLHSGTENAIKLLDHWEKYIIPPMQDMVKGAYAPWENLYYFEQLRDRLRKGDVGKAMEDALIICDQHLPNSCVLPKDNRDWSAFVNEECITGTWANAKVVASKSSMNPFMVKILERKLVELPVLIKAADWRMQAVYCEYVDPETKMLMNLIVPIDSLKEQDKPLSFPAAAFSYTKLVSKFKQNLKELAANLALRTLISIYHTQILNIEKLSDFVHWIVMDELKDDSIEGWLYSAQPILNLKDSKKQNDVGLISRVMKEVNSLHFTYTSKVGLTKLAKLENQIQKLNPEGLMNLNKWCIEIWKKLANEKNIIALNLTNISEIFNSDPTLCKAKDGNVIFPLHEHISYKEDNGACIITFEIAASLSPNSKLKFYSDPLGQCLVTQINAGKTPIHSIAPIIINSGKVWCHFHQGTKSNLTVAVQETTAPSFLPCCVVFVPAVWTTACWLGETLTTTMLKNPELKTIDVFYKPLISSICNFTQMPNIPSTLKQLAFVLINRIIRKMRYIYNLHPCEGSCLDKLGLKQEWLLNLVQEVNKLRNSEDSGEESTFSEYIQNAAELIASALLPFNKEDLGTQEVVKQLNLPDWIKAMLNVAIFLNYFRKEGQLTPELTEEIVASISINAQENIMVIRNIPKKREPKEVKQKLTEIFKRLKVRIVNRETDIIVFDEANTFVVVAVIDGFNLGYEESENVKKEEDQKAEEEKDQDVNTWVCEACTCINESNLTLCKICNTPFTSKPSSSEIKLKPVLKATKVNLVEYENEMWERLSKSVKETFEEAEPPIEEEPIKENETQVEGEIKGENRVEKEEVDEDNTNSEVNNKLEMKVRIDRGEHLFKPKVNTHLLQFLKERLFIPSKDELLPKVREISFRVYDKMRSVIKLDGLNPLVPKEYEEYTSAGLTIDKVKSESPKEFIKVIHTIAKNNPWLVWRLFAYYGYDMWLSKTGYFIQQDLSKLLPVNLLEDLLKMCEVEICKETKSILLLEPKQLRFSPLDSDIALITDSFDESRLRIRYPQILSHSLDEIRYNWAILKKFNDWLMKAIPYINWNMCVCLIPENSLTLTMSSFLSSLRKLCFGYLKLQLQQAVFSKTAVVRESPPRMIFERFRFDHNKKDNERSDTLEDTIFYHAYKQMRSIDITTLRPEKPEGSAPFLAFEVVFRGEYVVGEGGPYRQFFADVSAELQPSATSPEIFSSALNLLCPTPNTTNKQGNAQDKFTLTPSSKSTTNLLLYEFLGLLMGCCMRTGVRLALDLPSIIWKQIVQEPLSLADLEEVDNSVVGMLQYIIQPNLKAEDFDAVFTENFTAMLSDTSTIELIPDGTNIPVTYGRREEYAALLLKARLNESSIQCKAIRKGISLVVPEALLNFFTSQETSCTVCGRPLVDFAMLRRHTKYSKGLTEDSPRVQFLWEVLEELNETDKLRFIKFCWGQERLPANEEEYIRKQVRFMIKPAMRKDARNGENALPKADTCFFNLELPDYKTKEKLKEKLMMAIYTDFVSMNAEDDPALSPESLDSRYNDDN